MNQVAYAYGMMWVLLVGTAWLLATTYYGLNVSSTHSIIGGIIGFALSYNRNAVLWFQVKYKSSASSCGTKQSNGVVKNTACNSGAFPYSGIVPIVVTWFFAPTTTACAAALLFLLVRTVILRSTNSYERSFYLLPVFIFLTMFICIYFVFTKGAAATFNSDADAGWSDEKSGWVAVVIAAGCAIICACLLPCIKTRVENMIQVEVALQKDFMERRMARGLKPMAGMHYPGADDHKYPQVALPWSGKDSIKADTQATIVVQYGHEETKEPMKHSGMTSIKGDTKASIVVQYGNEVLNEPTHDGQAIQHAYMGDHIPAPYPPDVSRRGSVTRRGTMVKTEFFYGGMGVQTDRNAVHLCSKEGCQYFDEDCKNPAIDCCTALNNANKRSLEIDRRFMHEDVMDVSLPPFNTRSGCAKSCRVVCCSHRCTTSRPTDDPGR